MTKIITVEENIQLQTKILEDQTEL